MEAGTALGIPTVHTFTDLKAIATLPVPSVARIFVRSEASVMSWDPSSSETDDSITIITPTDRGSKGGRWVRVTARLDGGSPAPSRVIVSGAAFWMNPDTGLSLSGSNVDSWSDAIGGLTASQTGTRRPTFVTSSLLNNRPAVHLDQDQYQNLVAPSNQHVSHSTSEYTVFMVLAPSYFFQQSSVPARNTRQYVIYPGNDVGGAEVEKVAWAYKANVSGAVTSQNVHGYSHDPPPSTTPWAYAPVLVANRPMVLVYRCAAGNGAVFRNGVKLADGLPYLPRKFENGFTLFSAHTEGPGSVQTYYAGDCADLLVYKSVLTDQQIIDQSASLMTYYGIPSYADTPLSVTPELWINAASNYVTLSGVVSEIGNQGYTNANLDAKYLFQTTAGNRGLIGSVAAGGITYPTFEADGVDDYYIGSPASWKWTDIADADSFCIWAWLEIDALTINSGSYNHLNHAIFAQDGTGNIGLYARNVNGGEVYMYSFQSSAHSAVAAAVPPTGLIRVRARHDGVNLRIRVGNGTEVLSAGHTANTLGATLLSLFRYSTNATFFDGRLAELIVKMNPSAGDLTAIDTYHAAKYPGVT